MHPWPWPCWSGRTPAGTGTSARAGSPRSTARAGSGTAPCPTIRLSSPVSDLLLGVGQRAAVGALGQVEEIGLRAGDLSFDRGVATGEHRRVGGDQLGNRLGGGLVLLRPDQAAGLRAGEVGEAQDFGIGQERELRHREAGEKIAYRRGILVVGEAPDGNRLRRGAHGSRRPGGLALVLPLQASGEPAECRPHQPGCDGFLHFNSPAGEVLRCPGMGRSGTRPRVPGNSK